MGCPIPEYYARFPKNYEEEHESFKKYMEKKAMEEQDFKKYYAQEILNGDDLLRNSTQESVIHSKNYLLNDSLFPESLSDEDS